MEKITVIIPTYNRPQFIGASIESVLAQTLKPYQVIVVNNGSDPDTKNICSRYKNIEYYEVDTPGKSNACNFALKYTTGDYVWVLDDDDIAMPDTLERFVKPLGSQYDFSYSSYLKIENDSVRYPIGEFRIPNLHVNDFFTTLLKENFMGGASLFARTYCYRDVGGFDTQLTRSQDYDMAIRIARKFKGIKVEGPTYYYRQHRQARNSGEQSSDPKIKNRKWLEYDQKIFRKLYRELELHEYA